MLVTKKALAPILRAGERCAEQLDALQRQAKDAAQTVVERLQAVDQAIGRHDMAIEDMLESLEEWRSDAQAQSDRLQAACEAMNRRDEERAQRNESVLLSLVMRCHDALFALRRAAQASADWSRQLDLVEDSLLAERRLAGLEVLDRPGEPFSPDLYEAVSVIDLASPEDDLRIAEIYTCGYVYKGRVLRRAQAAVYQRKTDGKEDTRP